MATFNEDDIIKIRKFIDIKNRGLYASGSELTEVYNRVFNSNVKPTNCGQCIRGRIQQLEDALKRYEASNEAKIKASEAVKEVEVTDTKEDEKKAIMRERMAKARAARKINKDK